MRKKRESANGIELISSREPHSFLTGEAGCSIMSHPSIGGFALDGIVRDGKVEAADVGSGIPAWMTGARWQLKPASNGAWALLNQGLMQAALVSDGDSVRLGAFDPNWASSSLSWLIYRVEASGYFLLNNGAGGWLSFDGDALGLIRHDGALRAEMCWQLGTPVLATHMQAADIRQDKQESEPRSNRSRRLGKMSLFARN